MRPDDALSPQVSVILKNRGGMKLGFKKTISFVGKRERWMDGFIGERMGEVNVDMF